MSQLRIEPDGIETQTRQGSPLGRALRQANIAIEMPCGGFGLCGKCKVRWLDGSVPPPQTEELKHLTNTELAEGWRLACRRHINGDVKLFLPPESRPAIAQILVESCEREVPLEPAVKRLRVQVVPPSVLDERSDVQRLLDSLYEQHGLRLSQDFIPLSVLRSLPTVLRQSGFEVSTIIYRDRHEFDRLLSVEPLHPSETSLSAPLLGIAFDVGTTTLVGYLIDLETGRELAHAARLNPQVQFGDDIVARLSFALHETGGTRTLQHTVVKGLNEIISECCQTAGVQPTSVYDVVAVGNPTMIHLLLGIHPEPIAFAPYVPVFNDAVSVESKQIGLRTHTNANLSTLPSLAGYIGADTVAVMLAHLWESDGETAVALDIGTNGEAVLRHKGRYWCTSAAAGPAFEGGRIYHGMRAEHGAIAQVVPVQGDLDRWLEFKTIGGEAPGGLCGSGLIDVVSAMLETGVMNEGGRLDQSGGPSEWRDRLVHSDSQKMFILVHPEAAGRPEGIVLTQRDVRELQLAKGSIRAVTEVLLQSAHIGWTDVPCLYLAGAFGMYVNLDSARRIGLLPAVPQEHIHVVGNAAGAGAKLALRSMTERSRARSLAHLMEHVPMTGNPNYQDALIEFMGL